MASTGTVSKSRKEWSPLLSLAALGVVFGDIGTSPLYALRQCFHLLPSMPVDATSVLGSVSLITWALILVVCIKYAGVVLRFDANGRGGVLALLSLLIPESRDRKPPLPSVFTFLALLATGMLVGDGMITPAISVMSAVEGLDVITPGASRWVLPAACFILIGLFSIQRRGGDGIGRFMGPLMGCWFAAIATIGVFAIHADPAVLRALNPIYAIAFLARERLASFIIIGAVVLSVTGAEALYADVSHFGRKAIVAAWYAVAFPALLLAYYGQAAFLLDHPRLVTNPFFAIVPSWCLIPMVVLATCATAVASQAVISGLFTLAEQAMSSSFLPRLRTLNTSRRRAGQVYVPAVNMVLAICCIALVLCFRSSGRLASAYGLAVSISMSVTSILTCAVAIYARGWNRTLAYGMTAIFLAIDLSFVVGSLPKIVQGAWFPIAVAIAVLIPATTWLYGKRRFKAAFDREAMPIAEFVEAFGDRGSKDAVGTIVLLTDDPERVPFAGRHHWLRTHAGYERIVLCSVRWLGRSRMPTDRRVEIERLSKRIYLVEVNVGFAERPTPRLFARACAREGISLNEPATTFVGIEPIVESHSRNIVAIARAKLYDLLLRIRYPIESDMRIPADRLVRLGIEIDV